MKWFFVFSFLMILSLAALADDEFPQKTGDVLLNRLQLNEQLQQNVDETLQNDPQLNRSSKSVFKAVLFSAIVPGAGQIYNQSYWKAAAFLAIEAAAWAVNISYNNKGDDKDAEFKQFADEKWSEYRYWSYVNYKAHQDEFISAKYELYEYEEIPNPGYGNWYLIDENYYRQHEAEIKATMREIETQFPTGSGFTHHLPETKTQQYYEMIGKYPTQFGNAWFDADFNTYYHGSGQGNITPMNDLYAAMRDDANQYYKTAGYGTMVILVNHLISALDAGFTANKINRHNLQVTYQNRRYVDEYVNMFGINFSL